MKFLLIMFVVSLISCNSKIKKKESMPQFIDKGIIYGTIEDEKLIYSTWNKEVKVEDLENGNILFSQRTMDLCYMQPIIKENHVFYNYSNKKFRCVNYQTNEILWEITTNNRSNRFTIINDSIGLLDIKHSGILKINLDSGIHRFILKYENECSSPDLSPYPISFNSHYFTVNDWECETIKCFNNEKEIWSRNLSNGISQSIIYEKKIFVAVDEYYKSSNIFIIDLNTGEILSKHKNQHIMLRTTPILWRNNIIYMDYHENCIKMYDFSTDEISIIKRFNDKSSNFVVGQFILVDDFMFYQNNQFDIVKLNLRTNKARVLGKSRKGGISAVYISKNNQEMIFY